MARHEILGWVFGTFLVLGAAVALAEEGESLRKKLGDLDLVGEWFYDDLEAGIRKGKETGKPLLVVFRCVT